MARTILGLIGDDNKVYFGDPPCDTRIECIAEDVEGCVEWTGEHAKQVKVTITQATDDDCNDTYYGCVNWTTRKFQITIPDDCCQISCICSGTYTVTTSGCTICGGGDCSDTYILPSLGGCAFGGTIADCETALFCSTVTGKFSLVLESSPNAVVFQCFEDAPDGNVLTNDLVEADCGQGACGGGGDEIVAGYGGIATLSWSP